MEVRKSFPEEVAPAQRPERGMRIGQAKWRGRQGGWGVGGKRNSMCKGLDVRGSACYKDWEYRREESMNASF